jgi:hypothetical protein
MATVTGKDEANVAKPGPVHAEHAAYTPNMELIDAAVAASDAEANIDRKELFSRYKPAVIYSMLLSLALVMEGMDTGMINNFFAHPAYLQRFGWPDAKGDLHVSATWQSAIGNGNNCGSIIGLLINGYLQSRYGSRRVYMVCRVTWSTHTLLSNLSMRPKNDTNIWLARHDADGLNHFRPILRRQRRNAPSR